MLKFKSLTVQNFLSYGAIPTTIQLDRPGTSLIVGEDLDNTASGSGANGVGKTALLINGLTYGCYDRPISNIKLDNLINWVNQRNMIVSVNFEKDSHDYIITRFRKVKAGASGTYTTFTKNGKDITPAGAGNINEEIEKVLGIPYELFIRIVTFSAIHTPFLDLPVRHASAANQTDIIEELFGLKTLSEKAELLKKEMKTTNTKLETLVERMSHLDKEHERHEKQLETAKQRVENWTINRDKEIVKFQAQIQSLKTIDVVEQRKVLDQLELVEQTLEKAMLEQQRWDNLRKENEKHLDAHTRELECLQHGVCPYCSQGYKNESKHKEIGKQSKAEFTLLGQYAEKLELVQKKVKEQTALYKQTKAKLVVKNLEQLLQIDGSIKQLNEKITELQTAKNPYQEPLDELLAIKLDVRDMTQINELNVTLEHQNFLLKLLTKKDSFVRKALLNKHLPYLNKRLQGYLTDLGLPYTVEFTHEMTANISQFGHQADFGQLSNGQRARVNLALSFAFRDVLQSMHDHVNICLMDEVLDVGLDTVGINAAAKMLKRKARDEKLSLYIISHRDEVDSAFDRKLIVQLSGGFSSVRYEEE